MLQSRRVPPRAPLQESRQGQVDPHDRPDWLGVHRYYPELHHIIQLRVALRVPLQVLALLLEMCNI